VDIIIRPVGNGLALASSRLIRLHESFDEVIWLLPVWIFGFHSVLLFISVLTHILKHFLLKQEMQ